jgi:L-asparaginase/Glu-tRNA(Gln) amidotransferase subunit D
VAVDALAEPVDPGRAAVAGGSVVGASVAAANVAEGWIEAVGRAAVEQLAIAMTTATARPAVNDRLTETGRGGTA